MDTHLNIKEQADKAYPILQDISKQFNKICRSIEKKHKIKIDNRIAHLKKTYNNHLKANLSFLILYDQE